MSNYGPLCFLVGDYKEAIDHMAEGLKTEGSLRIHF